jgi:hypothetical protein
MTEDGDIQDVESLIEQWVMCSCNSVVRVRSLWMVEEARGRGFEPHQEHHM